MSSRDRHFDTFADHTLFKHFLLRAYLQAWAFKILQWGRAGHVVHFVDGFAGAGRDGDGNPGSPVIACQIAQVVRGHFSADGRELRVIAVEENKDVYSRLEKSLEGFRRNTVSSVVTFPGTVTEHIAEIQNLTDSQPTLYFLDPFGVRGLNASIYPAMLAGSSNEVFALFHDIGAARLRGVVHAGADVETQVAEIRATPSLFPELDAAAEHEVRQRADQKRAALNTFTPAARDAISEALGETAWEHELKTLSHDEARVELVLRFMRKLVGAGARYVQVIPMHGATGAHKYCLVHATKSSRGFVAMKEAVSTGIGSEEFPSQMRKRIESDLTVPVSEVLGQLRSRFSGKTVRWSSGSEVSARQVLLEETPVYHFQCRAIKKRLTELGWLRRILRKEYLVIT